MTELQLDDVAAKQVLAALDCAVLEASAEGPRLLANDGVSSEEDVIGSAFLEHYCQQVFDAPNIADVAPAVWSEGGMGMEANALEIDGRRLVAVRDLGEEYEERRLLVQRANEQSLDRQKLLKEVQKKEMLLRCIVHDLGNPLATVIMNLQRVERMIEDEKVRWSVHTALDQAKRQRAMIGSVLDVFGAEIASLDKFNIDVRDAPDLVMSARSIIDANRALAESVGVRLIFDADDVVSLPVRAESALLERVLENILANAVRHGGLGTDVLLRITALGEEAMVCVEDEGPGIPAGLERSVFEPYMQTGQSAGQSGLGLYFCKRSVDRWGGSIGCENRDDRGARFWFRLKVAK